MVLYGASGHCKVIIDILEATGEKIDFIVDDNPDISQLCGYPVIRNTGRYKDVIVSIGSACGRKTIVSTIHAERYLTAVHPSAVISPRATIADGSVIMQGAIVQSCAKVGKHCIVNTGASVGHDVVLEDYVHIAPHATVTGGVTIGEGTWIGAGTVIKQGVHIGKWCMIGAGSVVVDDIPDEVVAFGNKCRVIRSLSPESMCHRCLDLDSD
jgi:sugar O-acyltransferase (sialic acid O-acetyltransferase NeuD family)